MSRAGTATYPTVVLSPATRLNPQRYEQSTWRPPSRRWRQPPSPYLQLSATASSSPDDSDNPEGFTEAEIEVLAESLEVTDSAQDELAPASSLKPSILGLPLGLTV